LEPDHVVLSSVKPDEDGSGDLVIRVYETAGRAGWGQFYIKDSRQAWASDVWERKISSILCSNNRLEFELNPYEIKTILVRRQNES